MQHLLWATVWYAGWNFFRKILMQIKTSKSTEIHANISEAGRSED
jgi:hypothetical protein